MLQPVITGVVKLYNKIRKFNRKAAGPELQAFHHIEAWVFTVERTKERSLSELFKSFRWSEIRKIIEEFYLFRRPSSGGKRFAGRTTCRQSSWPPMLREHRYCLSHLRSLLCCKDRPNAPLNFTIKRPKFTSHNPKFEFLNKEDTETPLLIIPIAKQKFSSP